MAVARVARVAKTSSPARRTRRERRAGAAIAAEKRGSESSSDLTAADTVCAAVYPRLVEFLRFAIQSTGQKSHCVSIRGDHRNALF